MAITYIPIILDQAIFADGEAAQILSFMSGSSPPTAIAPATNSVAKAYRKGKMRLAFLLNWSDITNGNEQSLQLVLRSPFESDDGDQTNRPLVMITPASLPEPANFVMFASPYGGAPSGTPPVTAADYTATFNGKAIPNWSVGINVSILDTPDANEQSVWVHVLWGHTTGN